MSAADLPSTPPARRWVPPARDLIPNTRACELRGRPGPRDDQGLAQPRVALLVEHGRGAEEDAPLAGLDALERELLDLLLEVSAGSGQRPHLGAADARRAAVVVGVEVRPPPGPPVRVDRHRAGGVTDPVRPLRDLDVARRERPFR